MPKQEVGIRICPAAKRAIGGTGMEITPVGLGSWAIGGPGWKFGWGRQDDADSIRAVRHGIECGINWIDTAAVYGLGHAEEIVAEAVSAFAAADRPYVFTKCGLIWDERDRSARPKRIGKPSILRREVENSMRRLRTERIDLYQMHHPPDDGTKLEEYWELLLDLRKEGKVRAIGLSNHDAAQLATAERLGHVDALQPPFSLVERGAAERELPWCRSHGTGVIVYGTMHYGLLTGSFTVERARNLQPDDWRTQAKEFKGAGLRKSLALVEALRPIACRHAVNISAVAIAWTLAWPGVTGAIAGARNAHQIDDWISASTLSLSEDDLNEIAAGIRITGAGNGPARPERN